MIYMQKLRGTPPPSLLPHLQTLGSLNLAPLPLQSPLNVQVGTVKISMPGMQKLKAQEKSTRKAKAKAKIGGGGGE